MVSCTCGWRKQDVKQGAYVLAAESAGGGRKENAGSWLGPKDFATSYLNNQRWSVRAQLENGFMRKPSGSDYTYSLAREQTLQKDTQRTEAKQLRTESSRQTRGANSSNR